MRIGKRAEQRGVHHREDGVRADADGEGQQCDQRERRLLPQRAEGVTQILPECAFIRLPPRSLSVIMRSGRGVHGRCRRVPGGNQHVGQAPPRGSAEPGDATPAIAPIASSSNVTNIRAEGVPEP